MTTSTSPLPNRTANRGHGVLPAAWPFRNASLRVKLILAFLAVALIPSGLLAYLDNRSMQALVTQNANLTLFAAASQTAANLDNFITVNLNAARAEARLSLWQQYLLLPADQRAGSDSETDVVNTLRALSQKGQVFAPAYIPSYALLDGQGRSLQDIHASDMGRDYSGEDYFTVPLQTGQVYLSPIEFSPTTGEAALYFSSPVKDTAGKILGVLRVSYSAAVLQQLVLQNNGLPGERSFGILFDENQLYLAHGAAPELLYKTVVPLDPASWAKLQVARRLPNTPANQLPTNLPDLKSGLATVDTKQPYFTARTLDTGNLLNSGAVARMKTQPWVVAFMEPRDVFLAPVQAQNQATTILTLIMGVVIIAAALGMAQVVAGPIVRLNAIAGKVAAGDLSVQAKVETGDETGTLATTFNNMIFQLRGLISGLEQRVAERTRDLERRSVQLQAAGEVGRAATSILETDQLIGQVVELIRARFDLYYVGLFLVDETREWAVLRAGTGQAGQTMLARRHRIQIGEGMIGWSITNAQARIALEAGVDAVRLATAELPETRSEAALPLRTRGQVIGALTVQSAQPDAFDPIALAALQVMADQVAVALDNAHLFAESQAALEATRRMYGEQSRQAWQQMVRTRSLRYLCTSQSIYPTGGQWGPEMVRARKTGQPAQDGSSLAVPIKVRDQILGAVRLRKSDPKAEWTAEETALLQTLTEQLGVALESARLYQDTQRRAAREQLASQITARMRESLDVERVLQIAAREFGETLGASEVKIRLTADDRGSTPHD